MQVRVERGALRQALVKARAHLAHGVGQGRPKVERERAEGLADLGRVAALVEQHERPAVRRQDVERAGARAEGSQALLEDGRGDVERGHRLGEGRGQALEPAQALLALPGLLPGDLGGLSGRALGG